jgi:type I restriction enzyme, S subunit
MTEVETAWPTRPLGELVDVLDNRRVPLNRQQRAKRPGDIPYYGATGQVDSIDGHLFDEELCLLGEDGVSFLDPYPRKAYIVSGKSWVNNHAHVLRARPELLSTDWLCWALNWTSYKGLVNGTTRLKLTKSAMLRIEIPLPSRAQQDRIVAELERRLATLDAAGSRIDGALRRLADFVGSSLNEVVEAASGCPEQELDDLAERVTSGSRDWKPYYEQGTGVFVLTQNVRMRRLDISQPFHVDPPANDPARARSATKQDDILVTIVGANCGNLARVPVPLDDHFVCQSLALVRLQDRSLSEWVELYLAAPAGGQAQFAESYYGQGRPHLSFGDLKKTRIRVPARPVREAAIARFRARAAAAEGLSEKLAFALTRVQSLRVAVLRDAFARRPVSQTTVDEPIDLNKDHAVLVGS